MARQKSTFSVPLQTDILSGGNVGLSFGNGPLPVSDLIFLYSFSRTTDTQRRHKSKKFEIFGWKTKYASAVPKNLGFGIWFSAMQWKRFPHRVFVVRVLSQSDRYLLKYQNSKFQEYFWWTFVGITVWPESIWIQVKKLSSRKPLSNPCLECNMSTIKSVICQNY